MLTAKAIIRVGMTKKVPEVDKERVLCAVIDRQRPSEVVVGHLIELKSSFR